MQVCFGCQYSHNWLPLLSIAKNYSGPKCGIVHVYDMLLCWLFDYYFQIIEKERHEEEKFEQEIETKRQEMKLQIEREESRLLTERVVTL